MKAESLSFYIVLSHSLLPHGPFSLHSVSLPFARLAGTCMNRLQGCQTLEPEDRAIPLPLDSHLWLLLARPEVETPLSFCAVIPPAKRGRCAHSGP